MKILFFTTFDPTNFMCGYGSFARHTIMALAKIPGCRLGLAILYGDDISHRKEMMRSMACPAEPETLDIWTRKYEKWYTRRNIAGNYLFPDEKAAISKIALYSQKADLVIFQSQNFDPITCWLPKACKCPVIYNPIDSITRIENTRNDRGIAKGLLVSLARSQERKALMAGYKRVLFVTNKDMETALAALGPGKNVPMSVLDGAVDTDIFTEKIHTARSVQNVPILLTTGIMSDDHNFNVEAASVLVKKIFPRLRKKVKIRIAGKDPSKKVKALATSDGSVVVTGKLQSLVEEYHNADLLVAPLYSGTGFKMKIAEALSCGLPVVTTSHGISGFRNRCGSVYAVDDHGQMAAVIDSLLDDPARIAKLGKEAAVHARKYFSWDAWDRKLVNMLSEEISFKYE